MKECLLYYRLPKEINYEKKYIQKISLYSIQKLYKKKKLISTNIKSYIKDNLEKNNKNKERTIKGSLLYEKAVKEYKQKKYFRFVFDILKSIFLSKYQVLEIKNLVNYEMVKHDFL